MVCVVGSGGKPLMPTNEYRARKLLKQGRAEICRYRPFTIRILDREDGGTQPIEYCCDTGYQHIGISIKTEKRELVSEQRDLLEGEPERHRDRAKHRREKRNRKRYRKPRFDNRKGKICADGFAPSIRNRRDRHIDLFLMYRSVMPITDAVFEMGEFDTQVLAAVEAGKPLPAGADYQHGPRYGLNTLRAAVFARDRHTCVCCGKGIRDGAVLRVHHLGFRKGDHTDRMSNLATVCTGCHTPRNHKPGGKLWNLKPVLKTFRGAAFMTSVRWDMLRRLEEAAPDVCIHITYGAATKDARFRLHVEKSHANDAWAMGMFHPKHRTHTRRWQKVRRNDRVLEKFYDAVYIDRRDGKAKKGAELSCGRTRRSEPRRGAANERVFRGCRKQTRRKDGSWSPKHGKRSIRRERRPIRPGDTAWVDGKKKTVKSSQNNGATINFTDGSRVQANRINSVVHAGGWRRIGKE